MPPTNSTKKTKKNKTTSVRVRMYRHGLGDCFLLTFFQGQRKRHVLIDCGSLGATSSPLTMKELVELLVEHTDGAVDALVATHEHQDHVSAFGAYEEELSEIAFERVWVAWTENRNDALAKSLRKYERDLGAAAARALARIAACPDGGENEALHATGRQIRKLLELGSPHGEDLGAFKKTVDESMKTILGRVDEPEFLEPGTVLEPSWLPGIRVYVLAPPRSRELIGELGEHESPELYGVAAALADTAEDAVRRGGAPFDERFEFSAEEARERGWSERYEDPTIAWRRIDSDWLGASAELALQLDDLTNNTSLVLAFELIDSGDVLLFPGDAQLGSWRSWHDHTFRVSDGAGRKRSVTARDLLEQTVLYKVGHHASHNATLKEDGLEVMKRKDLIALIPVDQEVARHKPGWKMPAKALYRRLIEKTRGRVLCSDTGWPEGEEREDPRIVVEDRWIDVTIPAKPR